MADPDADESPDLWQLFCHYDRLYFRGELDAAAFAVEWAYPRMRTTTCFGSCSFGDLSKIILYEPMLQWRTNADMKNALLHLMIHAIIFVKHGMKNLGHGPVFRDWMDAINTCTAEDLMRPTGGYRITTTHDFSEEKSCNIQGIPWKCEWCGVTLLRATNLGPPSDSCCIENVSEDATCGNMLCQWHNHKMDCGGTYVVTKPRGQRMVRKGGELLLRTGTTEMTKSQGAVQQSDSDEVQKAIVLSAAPRSRRRLKPKQEFVAWENIELLSMGSRSDAKSVGSSSSKKAEDVLSSQLKRKQTSVTSEKHGFLSLGSCDNAKSSGSNTSRKAGKFHEPDDVKPYASQKKLKLVQDLAASEEYGAFSLGTCNSAKPPRSSTSRNAEKWCKSEGVEKSTVPWPAAPPQKMKLEQDSSLYSIGPFPQLQGFVTFQKHGVAKPSKSITPDRVGKLHKPDGVENSGVPPSTPLKKLKLEKDPVASEKHGVATSRSLPAAPLTKLKPDLVASEKSFGCGNAKVPDNISSQMAHKKLEHGGAQKHISLHAAPQTMLKQPNKTSSTVKAPKQHKFEDFRKATVQPAAPQSKLKQPNRAASERQKTRSKTKSCAGKKEYVCFSLWQNFYEPECSSGSDEPLVNKRSVRRKRERERAIQITYSRSRKRGTSGISSIKAKLDEEISSGHLEVIVIDDEVMTEAPGEQCKAPAPCMNVPVVPPTDQVTAEAPRGQSKPPVPSKDVPAVPPADQVTAEAPRGMSKTPAPSKDVPAVPPTDQVMTEAPRGMSKTPAPSKDVPAVPPTDQVMTETPRGQSQPAAQRMDTAVPPADHGDRSDPSTIMDIAAVPPAMTQAPMDQSQPPAPCSIAADQVVPPRSADLPGLPPSNPSSWAGVIDISDDDDDDDDE
ncbi:hypothetical protein CFC21_077582 [Triticum aestivum]|uniref:SprT-like domain-containing protein n=2 Tax=Triticum aestivum TaxID=4565 RepID=A0A9R1HV14_WHEAT|nr:uncharacterized protein LOC123121482 [Triticum aestivum]KAF7072462.1 hypothetical protein CFC21_077582 [Triticum aestivum]